MQETIMERLDTKVKQRQALHETVRVLDARGLEWLQDVVKLVERYPRRFVLLWNPHTSIVRIDFAFRWVDR